MTVAEVSGRSSPARARWSQWPMIYKLTVSRAGWPRILMGDESPGTGDRVVGVYSEETLEDLYRDSTLRLRRQQELAGLPPEEIALIDEVEEMMVAPRFRRLLSVAPAPVPRRRRRDARLPTS